ncbi:DUF6922 domain-containing protein [Hufsiella ginkgonis]|uniref:DUF6922 domain-containing protein n=1 Tax=Hufsiella ginkgonis TaxID=2695274 RepID=A0A7K1XZV3_9SPHI|nr:hypothetical protein [Hufsiella ginkgonis]MXV16541.1 hypothetical protein [Hufsiella ginkgonis]
MSSRNVHIDKVFPKHLFWDVDMSALNVEADRDLIIPRALMATTAETFSNDISRLEAFYAKAVIARELKATKERISDKVCLLVARRYHVKKFTRYAR